MIGCNRHEYKIKIISRDFPYFENRSIVFFDLAQAEIIIFLLLRKKLNLHVHVSKSFLVNWGIHILWMKKHL